jgi:3',5'-cyclic AMP phosphodiesterase CpdA
VKAALPLVLALAGCAGRSMPSYRAETREDAPRPFVLLSDTQRTMPGEFWRRDHEAERRAVARAVAGEDPAFVVNAGDVTCHGSYPEEWRRFREEQDPILSRGIPYYAALGNHDYYGDRAIALRNFFTFFPDLGGRRWYEIRRAPALVVVLDSNFDQLSPAEAAEQDRWLESTLERAERDAAIRHVLLVCHHPPHTRARLLQGSAEVRRRFVARRTPKVKVFFSGHVHAYERFTRDGVQFVVSGGAGGPPTDLEGAPPAPAFHYCRFTIEGERLSCDVVRLQDDGSWRRVDGFTCP